MPTEEGEVVEGTYNTSYQPAFVIVIGDERFSITRCPFTDWTDAPLGSKNSLLLIEGDVVTELLESVAGGESPALVGAPGPSPCGQFVSALSPQV